MRVEWFRGTVNPPVSGYYYVIKRSLKDRKDPITGDGFIEAGEFVMSVDFWQEEWEGVGKNNLFWAVEAWANIPTPDIPEKIADKMRLYFGKHVGGNNE